MQKEDIRETTGESFRARIPSATLKLGIASGSPAADRVYYYLGSRELKTYKQDRAGGCLPVTFCCADAAVRVGYEDPAYFSREYKKHLGAPPQRDIARLRSNLEL